MKKQTLASEMIAELQLEKLFLERKLEMIQMIVDINSPEVLDKLRCYVIAANNYDKSMKGRDENAATKRS